MILVSPPSCDFSDLHLLGVNSDVDAESVRRFTTPGVSSSCPPQVHSPPPPLFLRALSLSGHTSPSVRRLMCTDGAIDFAGDRLHPGDQYSTGCRDAPTTLSRRANDCPAPVPFSSGSEPPRTPPRRARDKESCSVAASTIRAVSDPSVTASSFPALSHRGCLFVVASDSNERSSSDKSRSRSACSRVCAHMHSQVESSSVYTCS